ncbi:acyltransferase [Microcoleus sp. FACHB-53]|nr:acyltransferase [Microcoleus sp. FACHB-53]
MKTINFIARLLRKIANNLDNESNLKNKIPSNVKLDASSELNISGLVLKDGCLVTVEEQTNVPGSLKFDRENARISIGKKTFINGSIIAAKSIEIGDDVMISWGVTIVDHNSHSLSFSQRADDVVNWRVGKKDWTHVKIAPVKISSKVWIGFNSVILKGVTIGEGAIVGAGSVVTKDVPAWTIVAGNPARVIREIPENER